MEATTIFMPDIWASKSLVPTVHAEDRKIVLSHCNLLLKNILECPPARICCMCIVQCVHTVCIVYAYSGICTYIHTQNAESWSHGMNINALLCPTLGQLPPPTPPTHTFCVNIPPCFHVGHF